MGGVGGTVGDPVDGDLLQRLARSPFDDFDAFGGHCQVDTGQFVALGCGESESVIQPLPNMCFDWGSTFGRCYHALDCLAGRLRGVGRLHDRLAEMFDREGGRVGVFDCVRQIAQVSEAGSQCPFFAQLWRDNLLRMN